MFFEKQLRTAAWYGDHPLRVQFPQEWDLTILWPSTPPPLTDGQIVESLERPVAQAPIRQLCKGTRRPLVIVDDLNRPTPASRVMPFLLRHFADAGIPAADIRILIATGTHAPPRSSAVRQKLGPEAAAACQVMVHDPAHNLVEIGRTSFGTPVSVNKEVVTSDFVLGIGGIYPNHTAGFGGGSKLALGVLGFRSIMHLHYRHRGSGWGLSEGNDFRTDLNEIAGMVHLTTMISLHVNTDREPVRIACGDHLVYYKDELTFCKRAFSAPAPANADVVISNAYPNDLSLTFVQMKGISPLRRCAPTASRIAIASCSEGMGHHGLFPFVNRPRFHRTRQIARRISIMEPHKIPGNVALRLHRFLRQISGPKKAVANNPIWVYRPEDHMEALPAQVRGIRITSSWQDILQAIEREQSEKQRLKVLLYACAPLQFLDQPEANQTENPQVNNDLVALSNS